MHPENKRYIYDVSVILFFGQYNMTIVVYIKRSVPKEEYNGKTMEQIAEQTL